jgi:hypothetical protein
MSKLVELFFENSQSIFEDEVIVLLPISRLWVDYRFNVEEFWLFPPNDEILSEIQGWDKNNLPSALRQYAADITMVDFGTVSGNAVVAYKTVFPREKLAGSGVQVDIEIILGLAHKAEFLFDVLRFYEGRINVPEYLPGRVGSLDRNEFDACVIIYPVTKSYNLVVGQAYTHAIKKGIGFRFDEIEIEKFSCPEALMMLECGSGDVRNIVKASLLKFSRILEANTPTEKFILSMSLFEFLASPFEYENFKAVKPNIIVHLCTDKKKYHELAERFMELSGKKDNEGKEVGYRTRIVHMGDQLEDCLSSDGIRHLLVEIQNYLRSVIQFLITNTDWNWSQVVEYRNNKKIGMGISPTSNR